MKSRKFQPLASKASGIKPVLRRTFTPLQQKDRL